jgi:hypothetical protein
MKSNLKNKKNNFSSENSPSIGISPNKNLLKIELDLIVEEYKSIRDEIISLQEFARQNIKTTYAGIGVLSAASPFIIEYDLQIFFLIFPIFFISVALTTSKYALAGLTMGSYLKNTTIPNARRILLKMNDTGEYGHIFSWEEGKGVVRKYGLFFLPANAAHYWVILFAALICVLAYFAFPPEDINSNILVIAFLGIDSLLFLYAIIVGLIAGFSR